MVRGGDGIHLPVVAAEFLEENERGHVAAEAEQAVERVLDVSGIRAARAQNGLDDRLIFPDSLPPELVNRIGQPGDGFKKGITRLASPSSVA